jgi:hypothetical protein
MHRLAGGYTYQRSQYMVFCSGRIFNAELKQHMYRFFDDIDLLRQRWHSENNESVAQL